MIRTALICTLCAVLTEGCICLGDVDVGPITVESPRRAMPGEPIVIAHRGASDYLPEPTLEAYTLAHAMQAPDFDPAAALVTTLANHGYASAEDPCIIQCFDLETTERLATLTDLRLVWLAGDEPTSDELDRAEAIAHGLGPNRSLLEHDDGSPKPLLAEAKARRLALYPYTFRNIRTETGVRSTDGSDIHRFMFEHRVEGLFCDNPDLAVFVRTGEAVNRQREAEQPAR